MKIRSAFVCAPALFLLAACGSSSGGDSSSAAGSGAAGALVTANSGGNSAGGMTNSAAGAASGGTANVGGTSSASAGAGGASAGASTGGTGGTGGATSGGSSGSSAAGGSGGAPNTTIPDTKVVMYLPNWNGSFASWATKIDYSKMTHLLLAFGTVNTSNAWSLGAADNDVKTLTFAAHAKNVKVLVSIGGADDDIGIINQYNTASNIDPLVANLDAFVTRLDLDGVDVDLERGADMKSSSNFPDFISKLESTFKPEGKFVTTALAQYIVQDMGTDAKALVTVNSFDFINLMIYSTNMSTYTNELNWWTSTVKAPKTKLTWGVEFATKLTTSMAAQLTTASKAYGGVMVWEYTQGTEPTLWPAVQGAL